MDASSQSLLVELNGQIERITYSNEETGYTVARVKVRGHGDLVTVVGNLMSPTPGEILWMKGQWSSHPKYGEQFKIVHYKTRACLTAVGRQAGSRLGLRNSEVSFVGPHQRHRSCHGQEDCKRLWQRDP